MEPGDDFITRLWSDYSRRIAEANAREAEGRLSAFCPQPIARIGGFPIVPLTLERYCILTLPEFWDDPDQKVPILRFLWVMNPDFDPDPARATEFLLDHIQDDLDGVDEVIREIFEYAFRFAPKSKSKGSTSSSMTDWISSLVDLFASEYGWTDEKILTTPVDRLFLYLQRIQNRKSERPITFSSEADRLRKEFMDIVNQQKVERN